MKKVGLKYPVVSEYGERDGQPVYTHGTVMAKAMKISIKWDKADATVYADDELDESDQSITGGKETLEINELTYEIQALTLGHQLVDGELSTSSDDEAPYVGHGFYGKVKRNGKYKYRAIWLYKMQYSEPDDENETAGNKPKFTTPKIEGTIMKACNNKFKTEKTFDTEAEAKAWLNEKAGIVASCSKPVADVEPGTYTSAQSVTLSAGSGETIYYTTDGLTPTASSTKYTGAISISKSTMLKAIATKSGANNSEITSYEYIINAAG